MTWMVIRIILAPVSVHAACRWDSRSPLFQSGADPGILKGGGGGPTTYSGAICIANKQNLVKKGGGVRTPWTPPWICPCQLRTHGACNRK